MTGWVKSSRCSSLLILSVSSLYFISRFFFRASVESCSSAYSHYVESLVHRVLGHTRCMCVGGHWWTRVGKVATQDHLLQGRLPLSLCVCFSFSFSLFLFYFSLPWVRVKSGSWKRRKTLQLTSDAGSGCAQLRQWKTRQSHTMKAGEEEIEIEAHKYTCIHREARRDSCCVCFLWSWKKKNQLLRPRFAFFLFFYFLTWLRSRLLTKRVEECETRSSLNERARERETLTGGERERERGIFCFTFLHHCTWQACRLHWLMKRVHLFTSLYDGCYSRRRKKQMHCNLPRTGDALAPWTFSFSPASCLVSLSL